MNVEDVKAIARIERKFDPADKIEHLGPGKWVSEPDFLFANIDEYQMIVERKYGQEPYNPSHWFGGFLCGYINVPKNHPWHGKDVFEGDLFNEISVHGGLTFSGNCCTLYQEEAGKPEDWWIGFDCAHYRDYHPSIEKFSSEFGDQYKSEFVEKYKKDHPLSPLFHKEYRDFDYVISECLSLIRQAKAAAIK